MTLIDLFFFNLKQTLVDNDNISQFAYGNASFDIFLMDTVAGAQSGTVNRILNGDSFLGEEDLVLVIETVDSCPDLDQRRRRRHEPVGAERQVAFVIKQGLERVSS